jgi:hypothetical protein
MLVPGGLAIELWRVKIPQRDIMKQLGMSKVTLMRVLAFVKKGNGHPTELTEATLDLMKKKLQKTPTLTAIQLKMRTPELEDISVRTIQRNCRNTLKMPSRTVRKKPLLTEQIRIQRLELARAYGHWDEDDRKQVMFTDESHFELHFGNQSSWCQQPAGSDPFLPMFTRKIAKHPQKVMAWGCFSWMGLGPLEFLAKVKMMNGTCYRRSWMTSWSCSSTCAGPHTSCRALPCATRQSLSRSGSMSSPTSSSSNGLGTPLTSTLSRMSGIG